MTTSKLLVATATLLLTLAGCGEGICRSGDADCECVDQASSCTWECRGGDCTFLSTDETESSFTCVDGGCNLTASGSTDVSISCNGGNCSVTDASDVILSCAGGGCTVQCGGSADCTTTECTDCTCTETDAGTCLP